MDNPHRTVNLEDRTIAGIPSLLCLRLQPAQAPLVIVVPGFGGSKEQAHALAYRLAQRGLACLSFDPLHHGARADGALENAADPAQGGVYPPDSGLDTFLLFYRVIRQSAADVAMLLAHLAGDPRLDVTRAGVTGMSMGAYAAFLAFAGQPALAAAVPMMGVPTFARRWQDLLDECAWSNPAWAAALAQVADVTAAHSAWVATFDPAEPLRRAAPRALLVMSGDFDSDQPKHYVLDWLRPLRAAYQATPERLRWNVYPVGHTVTPQMEEDAVDWFVTHLASANHGITQPSP
jgi:dienelactone hydrolase